MFLKPSKEPPHASRDSVDSFDHAVAAETPHDSESLISLASVQRADSVLRKLFQWVARGIPPSTHELQKRPCAPWQFLNEFRNLKVINDVLCGEFVHKGHQSCSQQLLPVTLLPRVLNSIHSSTTRSPRNIQNSRKRPWTFQLAWLARGCEIFDQSLWTRQEKSQPAKDPWTFLGRMDPKLPVSSYRHWFYGSVTIVER